MTTEAIKMQEKFNMTEYFQSITDDNVELSVLMALNTYPAALLKELEGHVEDLQRHEMVDVLQGISWDTKFSEYNPITSFLMLRMMCLLWRFPELSYSRIGEEIGTPTVTTTPWVSRLARRDLLSAEALRRKKSSSRYTGKEGHECDDNFPTLQEMQEAITHVPKKTALLSAYELTGEKPPLTARERLEENRKAANDIPVPQEASQNTPAPIILKDVNTDDILTNIKKGMAVAIANESFIPDNFSEAKQLLDLYSKLLRDEDSRALEQKEGNIYEPYHHMDEEELDNLIVECSKTLEFLTSKSTTKSNAVIIAALKDIID